MREVIDARITNQTNKLFHTNEPTACHPMADLGFKDRLSILVERETPERHTELSATLPTSTGLRQSKE